MDWRRIVCPSAWIQNYPTSLEWDAELNKALDHFSVVKEGVAHVKVGPYLVWIRNWPYAYGTPSGCSSNDHVLPRFSTRLRLRRAIAGKWRPRQSVDEYIKAQSSAARP